MKQLSNNRSTSSYVSRELQKGGLRFETEWPGIEILVRGLTADDLRAIAEECLVTARDIENPPIETQPTAELGNAA